jgi:hypothetical protein
MTLNLALAKILDSPPGPTFLQKLDEELLAARPHPGGSTLQRGDLLEVVGPSGSGVYCSVWCDPTRSQISLYPNLSAMTASSDEDNADAAAPRQDIRSRLFPSHIAPSLVFPTTSNPHHPADGDSARREILPRGAPAS